MCVFTLLTTHVLLYPSFAFPPLPPLPFSPLPTPSSPRLLSVRASFPSQPHSPPQDIVTCYAHQTGYHIERTFGWDCHGLPVEYNIDKTLGIRVSTTLVDPLLLFLSAPHFSFCSGVLCDVCVHIAHHNVLLHSPLPSPPFSPPLPPPTQGPEDVAAMGIAKYNAECRKIVMRYSKEWQVGGHAH